MITSGSLSFSSTEADSKSDAKYSSGSSARVIFFGSGSLPPNTIRSGGDFRRRALFGAGSRSGIASDTGSRVGTKLDAYAIGTVSARAGGTNARPAPEGCHKTASSQNRGGSPGRARRAVEKKRGRDTGGAHLLGDSDEAREDLHSLRAQHGAGELKERGVSRHNRSWTRSSAVGGSAVFPAPGAAATSTY